MKKLFVIICLLGITTAFSLLGVTTAFGGYSLGPTLNQVIEPRFNRPLFDAVSVPSERRVGQNIIHEGTFIETLRESGYVKEGVMFTDLYPLGELYYYVEWTNNEGSRICLRYFPGSPNNCVELSCSTVFQSDLVSLSDYATNKDGVIAFPFEFMLYTAH
jgi:hypothetical protein